VHSSPPALPRDQTPGQAEEKEVSFDLMIALPATHDLIYSGCEAFRIQYFNRRHVD